MSDSEVKKKGNPAAGCQNCGSSAWVLILDEYPPNHTKIVAFACSGYDPNEDKRTLCNAVMPVNIPLDKVRDLSDREEIVDNPDGVVVS
jgi:hypothetical protein